jgi:succinoglycan biosynthesis transport protein ExoP
MEGSKFIKAKERPALVKAPEIQPKGIDPIRSCLNHLSASIFIAIFLLVVGSGLVYLKIKPTFSTEAQILIEPVIPKILYGKEESSVAPYYDDYARTQVNLIKSYPVLTEALDIYKSQGFSWEMPKESLPGAIERLVGRLEVKQIRDTQLLALSMHSRSNRGLAELINAISTAYLNISKKERLEKDSEKLQFLQNRRQQIEDELQKRYRELETAGNEIAVGTTDERNIYAYLQSVVDVQQALVKARGRRIEIGSRLNEMKGQVAQLNKLDISADVAEWIEGDVAIQDNRIQMSRKLQDMRLILAGMKPDHPDRQQFEKSLDKLLEVQTRMRNRAKEKAEIVIRGKLISNQNRKILEIQAEYTAAKKAEKKMTGELTKAEVKATEVNSQMLRASTTRKDVKRMQDALLRIDERIDQLEVESRSPGRIYIVNKALTPAIPSAAKRNKLFIAAALLSVLTGVGYATAKDKLNQKICATQDVERVLGFPATGFILDAESISLKFNEDSCFVLDHPNSIIAEEFREIALALSSEQEDYNSQVFTWVSLQEKQGTTSLLVNTMCSLAGRNKKRIYVDLNTWSSSTRTNDSECLNGIWDVLEGDCSLKEAIVTQTDLPFHVLPLGNWNNDKQNLFQEMGLENIIQALRLDYEYIMIDSPPLTSPTDAKFLAKISDVTTLVVKSDEITEKHLHKSVSTLEKHGIKVLSVILNRVKIFRGGYYRLKSQNFGSSIEQKKKVS